MSAAELRVNKLLEKLGALPVGTKEPALTPAEAEFYRSAITRRSAKVYRCGWPDFLVDVKPLGLIGVEVKSHGDELRKEQRAMFEALEGTNLRVYVWHEATPDRLIPWRDFDAAKADREKARRAKRRRTIAGHLAEGLRDKRADLDGSLGGQPHVARGVANIHGGERKVGQGG